MPRPRQYEVYDLATDKLLVKGTERHCAAVLKVGGSAIGSIARGKYKSTRFRVVDISPPELVRRRAPDPDSGLKVAAKNWDAFCEPIRKKYGIPVHKAPVKEDDK